MNSSKTPERPADQAACTVRVFTSGKRSVDVGANGSRSTSSAAVTPSPQVNRVSTSLTSSAKGKRLVFADEVSPANNEEEEKDTTTALPLPLTPKRHRVQQTIVDQVMIKKKKAKLSAPPSPNEVQIFKSHTVYPPNKNLGTEDQVEALAHLKAHCFAAETLHLKTNDLVVTTQTLGDNVPTGTVGRVIGWTSIEDVRLGLGSHIQELRSSPPLQENQQEFEIEVSHKHAVDIMPASWYPDVLFQGIHEEEEGTVLPEAFTDLVPGIGTMVRCQLPLLRVPHCRCRPAAPAKLLRCHNHGPNHGRWFFNCAKPVGEQCGYFMWKTSKLDGMKKLETK